MPEPVKPPNQTNHQSHEPGGRERCPTTKKTSLGEAKIRRDAPRKEKVINGAKRTRTADPLHAMQVLYQLSYGPLVWPASLATN